MTFTEALADILCVGCRKDNAACSYHKLIASSLADRVLDAAKKELDR